LGLSLNRGSAIGSLAIAHTATMANDNFVNRIALSGNVVSALGYTHGATTEPGEPSNSPNRSLWWKYRPAQNGRLTITANNSVHDSQRIAAYIGAEVTALRLIRTDSASTGYAALSFPVTSGVDYIISFATYSSSGYGTAIINLSLNTSADVASLNTPPATMENDRFANRVTLTGDQVGAIAYNSSGTTEVGEPTLAGGSTFWWAYRPSANGILSISTLGTDTYYPVISVYFGSSIDQLKPVAYESALGEPSVSLPVTVGVDYMIAIGRGSSFNSAYGSLVLSLSLNKATPLSSLNIPVPATMANDAFANRVRVSGQQPSVVGYTLGATRETFETATGNRTIWFTWTANASGVAFLDFSGTPIVNELLITLTTGSVLGSLVVVTSEYGGPNQVKFNAIAGTQYNVSIGEYYDSKWRPVILTFVGSTAVPPPPNFTQHPDNGSGWLTVGQTLQLSAASDDTSAQYQWRQNAVGITGASAATMSRIIASVSMAGLYDVTAKNRIGTTISNDAVIGVMAMLTPTISVAEGAALALTISAKAPSAITYRWRRNGSPLVDGTDGKTVTKGSGTAALSITVITPDKAGTYSCEVSMVNPAIAGSPFLALSSTSAVGVVLKPVVSDMVVPAAAVSRSFSWQLAASQSPSGFIVSGLPSGLTVNATTGLITGIPNAVGQPRIKVSAKNFAGSGAVKEFTLNISGLPDGVVGVFSGLLPRQNDFNSKLGGWFTLTVASTGSFSGSVKSGLAAYSIKGRLDVPVLSIPTAVVSIPRTSPLPLLTLTLTFSGGLNSVSATLSNGSLSSTGEGRRHTWTSTSATAYASAYNSVVDLPVNASNDIAQPLGCGWQQMTIANNGFATGAGTTADGINYTFAGTLWPDGSLPQYAILYTSKSGSITGLPMISLGSTVPANRVSGWVEQIKNGPANSTDRTYRANIPLLRRNVDGAPWIKPTVLMPVVQERPDAPDNADIAFTKGGIDSAAQFASISQVFRIGKTNLTTFKAVNAGNPCAITMKITASNGRFTGSLVLNDTVAGLTVKRNVSYAGILLSHTGMGYGYFILPGLSPSIITAPILGGRVVLN